MRKSRTRELTDRVQGEHLALCVAAHLARTRLVEDPLARYDAQHLIDMVEVVAGALIKVAPVYVRDVAPHPLRELEPAELEGAKVSEAGNLLTLADGRCFATMTIRRADLRQAIAILRAIGVPGLCRPARQSAEKPGAARGEDFLRALAQVEELLRQSPVPAKVHTLLVSIARHAGDGRVANLAMQLMSALQESREDRVAPLVAQLRAVLEEAARAP